MSLLDPIQVRHYGEHGPCVVLLHGGPGAPGELMPVAYALESQFRITEPLQRISDETPLTVERHVTDMKEVLADTIAQESICLVGHSWGAMLALTYAARHSQGIERVILIGCGTFDEQARTVYQTNMESRVDTRARQRIEQLEAQLVSANTREQRNKLFGELGNIMTNVQVLDPIDLQPKFISCDERGHHETWNDALALQEQGVQPAEFANITAPVVMIHGREDPHPGPLIRKSLEPYIQNLQFWELPDCGHTPWNERGAREAFYDLLRECLS